MERVVVSNDLLDTLHSSLTNKLMVRVTNYFDTQVRVPSSQDAGDFVPYQTKADGISFLSEMNMPAYAPESLPRRMSDQQVITWYSKMLDSVRLRYRKLQRFARYVLDHQLFLLSDDF